ncbi:hypothetical protein C6A37_07410, partial [Desulfobacteraceae bacterium SEEP-SAG9]
MTQPIPYAPANTEVLSVAKTVNWQQTVGMGANLALQSGTANAFPVRNGTFSIQGHVYAYKENDLANNQLTGIYDPNDPILTSVTVAANSDIVLQKFVELHSTGTYGEVEVATRRKLIYHVPLPSGSKEEKESFIDTFEDQSNWEGSTWGDHNIRDIGGDKALKVIDTIAVTGAPKASLIALKGSLTGVNLALAHRSAGYLLSYDAQVKIGFDPPSIPEYYAAGISFRLDNNNNSYGLSFLRGSNNTDPLPDNIDNGIVPEDQKNIVVLWQQTNSGATRKWLAYKDMQSRFTDDMESGPGKWPTVQDLWHQTTPRANSPAYAWLFGMGYTIGWNRGLLISDPIDLCGASSATLSFYTWRSTDLPNTSSRSKRIAIRIDGVDLEYLDDLNDHTPSWQKKSYDLSLYDCLGKTVEIVFDAQIDSLTTTNSESWYIDDVRIEGDFDFPINESTLLV